MSVSIREVRLVCSRTSDPGAAPQGHGAGVPPDRRPPELNWEPQSGQVPASETITAHLEAGWFEEAIPLLRTRLQLEPDHVESLYNLGMVCSDRMELTEARQLLSRAVGGH